MYADGVLLMWDSTDSHVCRFASGDSGPGANKDCTQFNPGFPGTCPYVRIALNPVYVRCLTLPQVTTVGGTSGANPEVGIGYSGGGFSNVFKVPDYQKAVVQSYVQGMHGNNSNLFKAVSSKLPLRIVRG
jgi:tripeptidyl-peptidase-1